MHLREWPVFLLAVAAIAGSLGALLAHGPVRAAVELEFFAVAGVTGTCTITVLGPNLSDLTFDASVTATFTATGGRVSPTTVPMTGTGAPGSPTGSFGATYTPTLPSGTISVVASNGMSGSTNIIGSTCTVTQPCPSNPSVTRPKIGDGAVLIQPLLSSVTSLSKLAIVGGGGLVETFTNSTSQHVTHTRVDGADIQAFQTRITALLGGSTIYDKTLASAPGSAEVTAAFTEAANALRAAQGTSISDPNLVSTSDIRGLALKTGERCNHREETPTITSFIGPGTIFANFPNGDQSFFVAAGTVNFNLNVHTETFIDDIFQATVTHLATYAITANPPAASSAPVVQHVTQPFFTVPRANESNSLGGVLAGIARPAQPPAGTVLQVVAAPALAVPITPPNTGDGGLR